MVYEWLPKAYANGADPLAREKMHNASLMAGFTFTNTALGIVHSCAHQIGAEYGIPHGLANAIMMPYVVQYNMPAAAGRYSDIVKAIGDYKAETPIEGTRKFVEYLRDLQKTLNMPTTIKQMGVDEADFKSKLDMLAKNAMADGSTPPNPRVPSIDDLKMVYMCAYNGVDVI